MTKSIKKSLILIVLVIVTAILAGVFISAYDGNTKSDTQDTMSNIIKTAENNGKVDEVNQITTGTKITNQSELSTFLNNSNASSVGYLANSFDISNGFDVTSKGLFEGKLYGNGHTITITGVSYNGKWETGTNLFGTNASYAEGAYINMQGGIIPAMSGATLKDLNVIQNVQFTKDVGEVRESSSVGGIVGVMTNGSVLDNCTLVQNAGISWTKSTNSNSNSSSSLVTAVVGGCVGTLGNNSVVSNVTYTIQDGVELYAVSWGRTYMNGANQANKGTVRSHVGGIAGVAMNGANIFNVTANGSGTLYAKLCDTNTSNMDSHYTNSVGTAGIIVGCAKQYESTTVAGTGKNQKAGYVDGAIINWHGYAKYHNSRLNIFGSEFNYEAGGMAVGAAEINTVTNVFYLSGLDTYKHNDKALVCATLPNADVSYHEINLEEYASGIYENNNEVYTPITNLQDNKNVALYFDGQGNDAPLAFRYVVPLADSSILWRVIISDDGAGNISDHIPYYSLATNLEEARAVKQYTRNFARSTTQMKLHIKVTTGVATYFEYGSASDYTDEGNYLRVNDNVYNGYKVATPALSFYYYDDQENKHYTTGEQGNYLIDDNFWGVLVNGSDNEIFTMEKTRDVPYMSNGEIGYYILKVTDRRGANAKVESYCAIDKENHLISYTADNLDKKDLKVVVNPKKVTLTQTAAPSSDIYSATAHTYEYVIPDNQICVQSGKKDTNLDIVVDYVNATGQKDDPINVGSYTATVSADKLVNKNYTFDTIKHEIVINKKDITVAFDPKWDDVTYNGQDQRLSLGNGISVDGLQGGHLSENILNVAYNSSDFKNVGEYRATVSLQSSLIANNYNITTDTLSKNVVIKRATLKPKYTLSAVENYTGSTVSTFTSQSIAGFLVGFEGDTIIIDNKWDFEIKKKVDGEYNQQISTFPSQAGDYRIKFMFDEGANGNYKTEYAEYEYYVTINTLEVDINWNDFVDGENKRDYNGVAVNPQATLSGVLDINLEKLGNYIRDYSYYDVNKEQELFEAPVNAGTYKVTANIVKTDNYTLAQSAVVEFTFEISKLDVYVELDAQLDNSLQYGDEIPDYTQHMAISQGSFFDKDNVNIVLALDYVQYGTTLGEHRIILDTERTTGEFDNYNVIIPETAKVTVTKRSISPIFFVENDENGIIYNGNAWSVSTEFTFTGFEYTVNYSDTAIQAGDYTATAVLTEAANNLFELSSDAVNVVQFTVERRDVTININEITVNYGEEYSYSWEYDIDALDSNKFLLADSADESLLKITLSSDADNVNNAGVYDINVSITGANSASYNVTINNAQLNILHIIVDITWQETLTWQYDGTDKTVTATINNTEIDATLDLAYEGNVNKNAGDYVATASLTGENAINYKVNTENASTDYSITKVKVKFDLKVSEGVKEITYGDEIPTFEGEIEMIEGDFIESDKSHIGYKVEAMCNRYDPVGEYVIGISLVTQAGDEVLNNYEVEYPQSDILRVLPKSVTVMLNPISSFEYDGVERTVVYRAGSGEVLNSDDINPIILVNGDSEGTVLDSGDYTISVNELGNSNYVLSGAVAPVTFTISQRTVTINVRDGMKGIHAGDDAIVFGRFDNNGGFTADEPTTAYRIVSGSFVANDITNNRVKVQVVSNVDNTILMAQGTLTAVLSINVANNYKLVVNNTAKIVISGRQVASLEVGNEPFVYSGRDMASEIFFKDADMSMLNVVVTTDGVTETEFKNAGKYKVVVSATQEAIDEGLYAGQRTFDITIDKAKQDFSNVKLVVNYNKITVVVTGEFGEVLVRLDGGEFSENLVFDNGIESEKYYHVFVKLGETENYYASEREKEFSARTGIDPVRVTSYLSIFNGTLTFETIGDYRNMLANYEKLSEDDKATISTATLNSLAEQYKALIEGAASAISGAQGVASKAAGMGLSLAVGLITGAGAILLAKRFF